MAEVEAKFVTLTGDEVMKIADLIRQTGCAFPHPQLATVEIAVVEGELAGFACSQMIFHAEPIYVQPKYRGTGIAEKLAERVTSAIEQSNGKFYVAVAENQFAENLCREQGMREVPGKLFVREL